MFEKYLTPKGRLSSKQPQDIKNNWYINKFKQIHGNKYDYSLVEYQTQHVKVCIKCPIHGEFFQTPQNHMLGNGCEQCGKERKILTLQEFQEKANKIHGDRYDYSITVYTKSYEKVNIRCPEHGIFSQRPDCHLSGQGCPGCQHQRQDTIYLLRCNITNLVKIGITSNLEKRICSLGGSLQSIYSAKVDNPRQAEKHLHKVYQKYAVFNDTVRSGGTEFFSLTQDQIVDIIHYIVSI